MAMVTRKIRHKNGDGSIVEAEIGAKAENVLEDENHRVATDAEKTSWNGKVDSDGGDIANTKVSEFAASSAQWPVPAAGESPKTLWGKVKKFIEDFKNWMAGVCLIGQIVNDCVTNNANLPLSAAQGKVLMDLYTVLNANVTGLKYYAWNNSITDCNDATENNVVYAAYGNALNRPQSNDAYFTVWAYTWDGNNSVQFASEYGRGANLYCRQKTNSGWTDWERLYP